MSGPTSHAGHRKSRSTPGANGLSTEPARISKLACAVAELEGQRVAVRRSRLLQVPMPNKRNSAQGPVACSTAAPLTAAGRTPAARCSSGLAPATSPRRPLRSMRIDDRRAIEIERHLLARRVDVTGVMSNRTVGCCRRRQRTGRGLPPRAGTARDRLARPAAPRRRPAAPSRSRPRYRRTAQLLC